MIEVEPMRAPTLTGVLRAVAYRGRLRADLLTTGTPRIGDAITATSDHG